MRGRFNDCGCRSKLLFLSDELDAKCATEVSPSGSIYKAAEGDRISLNGFFVCIRGDVHKICRR